MRLGRISGVASSVKERVEHLSADVLWAIIKKKQSLPNVYVQHANDCRDCREFVEQFSAEARAAGFLFPDLLPRTDTTKDT
jgi:hypothetical protein